MPRIAKVASATWHHLVSHRSFDEDSADVQQVDVHLIVQDAINLFLESPHYSS